MGSSEGPSSLPPRIMPLGEMSSPPPRHRKRRGRGRLTGSLLPPLRLSAGRNRTVAFRPEGSATAERQRSAFNLQDLLFPGREETPASAITLTAIAAEDKLQARIALSGRRSRDRSSSSPPLLPPRQLEEVRRNRDLICRSGRPATASLLRGGLADPPSSPSLHHAGAAADDSCGHRTPLASSGSFLPNGITPNQHKAEHHSNNNKPTSNIYKRIPSTSPLSTPAGEADGSGRDRAGSPASLGRLLIRLFLL